MSQVFDCGYQCKAVKGFTLIELIIAMAIMTIIGLAMANLNSTVIEQQNSAKTKTYMQGVLNRFVQQIRVESQRATTFSIDTTGNTLTLTLPAIATNPANTVVYAYNPTTHTMQRIEGGTTFSFTSVLPPYLQTTVGFACGIPTDSVKCFEKIVHTNVGESLKIARVTVQTFTPASRQTRITQAFGELGVSATDILTNKSSGLVI